MADLSTTAPLNRASVQAAHALIAPHIHRTPVVTSQTLTALASTPRADLASTRFAGRTSAKPTLRLWFKCENLQRMGAFKARGAFHALSKLLQEPGWVEGGGKQHGVATHSSGNHAQALALAAKEHGIPAHIIMPSISAPAKIAAARDYSAHIVFSGSASSERQAVADQVVASTGARFVPPYDHPDIILGQGTLGLELQAQASEIMTSPNRPYVGSKARLDAIMTPCGGGGMLSGVALSCEAMGIRVFGAEPSFQGADDAKRGFESGARIEAISSLTVADGLRTPLGAHPWDVVYTRGLVDGMYSVGEDDIVAAMRLVFERMKMVVEPSACVPLAVALFDEDFRAMVEREAGEEGWDLGIVLSGGNVGADTLGKLFGVREDQRAMIDGK
ncbi:hypothetical protein ARSEF4850_008740 [Beauveria asiatica]